MNHELSMFYPPNSNSEKFFLREIGTIKVLSSKILFALSNMVVMSTNEIGKKISLCSGLKNLIKTL